MNASRTGFFSGLHPTILRMASAHMMVDGYGNIYAPLLPLLIPKLQMSLMAAGAFAMLFQLAASIMQVVFGHVADRWRPRVLVIVGPFVAVAVLSFVGVAGSKPMLAIVLTLGGLGTAAFHPSAAALAHRLGGASSGLAMSVYITGGTIGISFGPLVFAPFVERFGLAWTPLLALPGLLVVSSFASRVPRFELRSGTGSAGLRALTPYARPLAWLYAIVVLRTLTSLAIATFVPVMLTRRGMSVGGAGMVVAAYLFASGLGGFLGGPFADRFGPRRVIILSLVLSTPFLIVAPMLQGALFVVALALGGFFLQSTLPVNVTFGQALAPVSTATVSSLMMGFAWGTGGLSVPLVGMAADRIGIERTLLALSVVPLVAAACALPLPARSPGPPPHGPGPLDADAFAGERARSGMGRRVR
jgi:FSR family fosmidomycin resistance protein-like MFS transporter